MLMGTYERAGVPWSPFTTPWDFGQDLLPNDLDRIAPSLAVGFEHFPALGQAGIRKVVNGPFTFAPDGNPLVGPIKGLRNFWVACGVMAGFSQGGGVGLALSRWMVGRRSGRRHLGHGRRALRRLDHARLHQCQGARELFAPLPHPLSERGASSRRGRCAPRRSTSGSRRSTPCSATTARWSIRLWFAPSAAEASDEVSFRRSNSHPHVAAECRAVRERRGSAGDLQLRQVRRARPGRRRMAVARHGEPRTRGGPDRADADAERARQADRRFHDVPRFAGSLFPGRHLRRGDLLPALVRAPPAAARRLGAALRDGVHGTVGGGPEVARAAAEPGARRFVERGISIHVVSAHGSRHGAGLRRARLLHRRAGL